MTLVEILIVMTIMAMIAAAVGMNVVEHGRRAREQQARIDARSIRAAAEGHVAASGERSCPDVAALVASGILSRHGNTSDPWGQPYRIECTPGDVVVRSAGPDGQHGTGDDIL